MTQTKHSKEYKVPQFQLIIQDEQNKIFFAASETPDPGPGPVCATLSNINGW